MFKFLHAADLHLDSPLRGLDRYEGAPVDAIRQATRKALENLVELAISEGVAFVLIAGDVYDGKWKDHNTGQFFARQMHKLDEAGIDVFLIRGNHDAESIITNSLTLPKNVFAFPTDKSDTRIHEPTGAAIHGQGFAKRSVTIDLSAKYPHPVSGAFNIGLLHTSAAGYAEHETYAPCSVEGLCDRGYEYWALGHVHTRQALNDCGPVIAYSGNTQGRHAREFGEKGCLLVTVADGRPEIDFRPLDVFRWEQRRPNAAGCHHPDDLLAMIAEDLRDAVTAADGRPIAARIEAVGRCEAHAALNADPERWEQEVRGLASRETGEAVWIEKVRFATSPPTDSADLSDGPLAELRGLLSDAESDAALLLALSAELADLQRKLPREVRDFLLRDHPGAIGLDDPHWLRPLVNDAGQLLLGRLTEGLE
ncbi:MAG: DNA repair exonuclease [Planctomycetota bacterium]|nr:DNA repair exonuclease [Planctomycetaceae bacterium]MDQ3329624.1 DNA repair exonuclease [Planctomycetota bacterium]